MAGRNDHDEQTAAHVYEPPTDEQLANFIVVITFGPGANDEQRKTTLGLIQAIPFLKTEWLHHHREMQEAATTTRSRIWGEPLTASEREILVGVIQRSDPTELRRWLNHVVRIHDALLHRLIPYDEAVERAEAD